MGQAIKKIVKISIVFLFMLPAIMVLRLEGPTWPAIQFLIIQTAMALMLIFWAQILVFTSERLIRWTSRPYGEQ